MKTWVALLRGINVGGHRKVPMAEFRDALARIPLTDVRTYIQSGNVGFLADGDRRSLEPAIADAIEARFGFAVPVVVLAAERLREIAKRNPYPDEAAADPKSVHLLVFSEPPPPDAVEALRAVDGAGDEIRVDGDVAYLKVAAGYHASALSGARIERTLGVAATARNWQTVTKLLDLASTG